MEAITVQNDRLFDMSTADLGDAFAALPGGQASQLQGAFVGKILGLIGADLLPAELKPHLFSALALPVNPWKGKTFSDEQGANMWLSSSGRFTYGAFTVQEDDAHDGSGKCVTFNYDVAANPRLLRPILGECRPLETSYLCRMLYRGESGPVNILYFTLNTEL